MDNNTPKHIDINLSRLLYNRYKLFVVPFLVIVVVVGVFIKFNVPGIADLFKSYEVQKSAKLTLEVMKNNLNFLKQMESSRINSQYKAVSKALPINKDFESILNAISDVSNKSGVTLGEFKFAVGSLSKEEEMGEYTTLNLKVNIVGKVAAVDSFMEKLAKTLPLSEIVKISSQNDISTVTIDFYYKPLKTSKSNDELPIVQISDKGLSLISEMTSFVSQTPTLDEVPLPTATSSANPFF
jgi:Tfp pilus assembly protein PilO